MREKIKLEGKFVTLEEIEPKFFPYVIKWRNDPKLNRYLNQPFVLTEELERKWYEETYLPDEKQGFLIAVDKKSGEPFGTTGWINLDLEKRLCITMRLLSISPAYAFQMMEARLLTSDYLYEQVDTHFGQVSLENIEAVRCNEMCGYVENKNEPMFPELLHVNGISMIEIIRTKEQYLEARRKLHEKFPKRF